jgi:hypothetical protein
MGVDSAANDLPRMFRTITVQRWEDLLHPQSLLGDYNEFGRFVFRGQAKEEWHLRTTFERAAESVAVEDLGALEQKIIREFRRRAQHYLSDLPEPPQYLEWLAIMQHHGCPTRLLDFTRSFFIALFFAVEDSDASSAVWAINTDHYRKQLPPLLFPNQSWSDVDNGLHLAYSEIAEEEANEIIASSGEREFTSDVLLVEPYWMNERLSIQQGVFLLPTNLRGSFEKNLCYRHGVRSLDELAARDDGLVLVKIIVPKDLHLEIINLLTMMNISAATLFPGLDGYARSQKMYVQGAKLWMKHQKEFMRAVTQMHQRNWETKVAPSRRKTPKARD